MSVGLSLSSASDVERRGLADARDPGNRRREIAEIVHPDDAAMPAPAANNSSVMWGLKLMILGGRSAATDRCAPESSIRLAASAERPAPGAGVPDRHVGIDYNAAWHPMGRFTLVSKNLSSSSPDAILGLMGKFRADPSPSKVDLGVGVYRDLSGNTPVLSCVRRAEREVLAAQSTKSYVAPAGREEFNAAVEELVLGTAHAARRDRRARTVQAPGGCGALRLGAELIRAAAPAVTVHVSDPTLGATTRPCSAIRACGSSATPTTTPPRIVCASRP